VKLAVALAFAFVALRCPGDVFVNRFFYQPPPPPTAEQVMQSRFEEGRRYFHPPDPWRIVSGQTFEVSSSVWLQFVGKVVEVHPTGIRIQGYYGSFMTWPGTGIPFVRSETGPLPIPDQTEFFVRNLPCSIAQGDVIYWEDQRMALASDVYTYNTVNGSSRTLHCLDYGTPVAGPAPHELTAGEKKAAEERKAETEKKVLELHRALAEKNDPYGLFQMGRRYFTGDGVGKDEAKGKELLWRARAAGSIEAESFLKRIERKPQTPSSDTNHGSPH
jgi:hypothetical protein